jgi:hypothetical protein
VGVGRRETEVERVFGKRTKEVSEYGRVKHYITCEIKKSRKGKNTIACRATLCCPHFLDHDCGWHSPVRRMALYRDITTFGGELIARV